jgi:hypothetical protein
MKKNPLKVLKFEKIAMNQWDIIETKIFELDLFLVFMQNLSEDYSTDIVIYLLDDFFLFENYDSNNNINYNLFNNNNNNNNIDNKNEKNNNLLTNLYENFRKKKSFVTSWSFLEQSQFKIFILNWYEINLNLNLNKNEHNLNINTIHNNDGNITNNENNNNNKNKISLLTYWNNLNSVFNNNNNNNSINKENNFENRGVIAFEIIKKIGIIIRKNEKLFLNEDIWCYLYPNELKKFVVNNVDYIDNSNNKKINNSNSNYDSNNGESEECFGFFLEIFFPQLKQKILKIIKNNSKNIDDNNDFKLETKKIFELITVKYFAHKINNQNCDNNTKNEKVRIFLFKLNFYYFCNFFLKHIVLIENVRS